MSSVSCPLWFVDYKLLGEDWFTVSLRLHGTRDTWRCEVVKLCSQRETCYLVVDVGLEPFSRAEFLTGVCFLTCPGTFCWSKGPCLCFLNQWEHFSEVISVIHGGTHSPGWSGTTGLAKRCSKWWCSDTKLLWLPAIPFFNVLPMNWLVY